MSLTTQWSRGQLTTDEFISRSAADLHKGFSFFAHMPFAQQLVDWTVNALVAYITATTGSGLIAVNIGDAIKSEFSKLVASPAA